MKKKIGALFLAISMFMGAQDKYPVLVKAENLDKIGVNREKLQDVSNFINNEIKNGFPGAQLVVVKDGEIILNEAYGYRKKYEGSTLLTNPDPNNKEVLYDLASNTKMYATNFALQKLVYEKKLDVKDLVSKYIPEFKDREGDKIKGKDKMTVEDILTHRAGFKPDPEYPNPKNAGDLFSQEREKTMKKIMETPLEYEPGSKNVYSDVDYMLLGMIIERVTGKQLDTYVEEEIYKPLGLKNIMFNPLRKGIAKERLAPTELNGNTRDGVIEFPNIRRKTIEGEVHDEKAFYSMDGVSGHAGLFGTATDVAVLTQVMLNNGGYGDKKFFDEKIVKEFTSPSPTNPTYGLGWRRHGNESMDGTFSSLSPYTAYGHTGWTGTFTLIDSTNNLAIVLLTNRKHTPVLEKEKNPHKFVGDTFDIGGYGKVVEKVYESFNNLKNDHKVPEKK